MSQALDYYNDSMEAFLNRCADSDEIRFIDGSRGITHKGDDGRISGVCMPQPCALGCSFDRRMVRDIGRACGSMASELGYNAVLSPEAGIVRSPLSGRAAERFGEDPYLCGSLVSSWIEGAQSSECAAVLNGFLSGAQSNGRFICDSIIDKRALYEMYLKPYELAVKKSNPAVIQSVIENINGVIGCENYILNDEILRHEWKYKGIVAADLRFVDDCGEAICSGVDLCLPRGGNDVLHRLRKACYNGAIPEHYTDKCTRRLDSLMESISDNKQETMSQSECRELAQYAAEQCAVLLKNNRRTLPMPLGSSIALIGNQAKFPRIQRGGINAVACGKIKNMLNVFDENRVHYKYCQGWISSDEKNEMLIAEAVECASKSEYAVIFAGFEDEQDNLSEDRKSNQLPRSQVKLINAVAKENPNTVVVVSGGALPKMNWIGRVKSVLYMPLCGEECCAAAFNLLFGFVNPCGRLAVTYSLNETDSACGDTFGTEKSTVEFRESIYVGYRFYNKAKIYAAFPFGYGLSYTSFEYSSMRAVKNSDSWDISINVKNTGMRDGFEIVQFYVEPPKTEKFRPVRELKQFEKVYLQKGEEKLVSINIPRSAFAFYDLENERFRVNSGRYRICAAAASNDIRADVWVSVKGEQPSDSVLPKWYLYPMGRPQQSDFHKLFGRKLNQAIITAGPKFSIDNTLLQLSEIKAFSIASAIVKRIAYIVLKPESESSPDYLERMNYIMNMPVKRLSCFCHGLYPMKLTKLVINISNYIRRWKK